MFLTSRFINGILIVVLSLYSVVVNSEEFDEDIESELVDFYGDEDFVSIATGSKQLIHKAPSTATVISAKQIENMGALTVAEALENVPGLHVYPSPFNRLNTSFSIRGIHSDQNPQVLFLINGSPIREEYTGARPQTFKMPVHSISRIEIIRGPGSAIYGADAYSGVINIITKDFSEIAKASWGINLGSFDTSNIWYQNAFKINEFDFGLTVENLKSNGDDSRIINRDLQTILDEIIGTSVTNAPTYLNTNYDIFDFRLNAKYNDIKSNFWYWNNKAGHGAGAAQALDPGGTQNTSIYQFDISYDWDMENWKANIQYGYYLMEDRAEFAVLPAGAVVPIGSDGNLNLIEPVGLVLFSDGFLGNPQPTEKTNSLDFSMLSTSFSDHKIRFGLGFSKIKLISNEEKNFGPGVIDTVELANLFSNGNVMVIDGTLTNVSNTPYVFISNVDRENSNFSAQDEWQFKNDWSLTSGVRFDKYSDFGSTINPRAALVWEMSQSMSSKFLYGRAFRAPAFDTLYAMNNPVGIGNPNLKPETINTYEFSINKHLINHVAWSINLFRYDSKQLIEFVPDAGATTTTAQNVGKQKGYGFESEYSWKGESDLWQLNYSWQRSKDVDTDNVIPLAPQQLFNFIYETEFNNNSKFVAKLNWVGKRAREVGDTRIELDSFATLDFAYHFVFDTSDVWKVSIIGKNVLNENAFEPSHPLVSGALTPISDYPIQGSSFYLQLSKSLQ